MSRSMDAAPRLGRDDHMTAASAPTRSTVFRFGATALVTLSCLFAWCAVLSFDVADWPATSVSPTPAEPNNLCGKVGAHLAYNLFYYFGGGAYAVLASLTALALGLSKAIPFNDAWLRFFGATMVCCVTSVLFRLFAPTSETWTLAGPGGIVGAGLGTFLDRYLSFWGSLLVLIAAGGAGMLLAADNLVLAFSEWLGIVGRRSAPLIRDGTVQVAAAGAAAFNSLGAAGAALLSGLGSRGEESGRAGSAKTAAKKPVRRRPAVDEEDGEDEAEETPAATKSSRKSRPAPVDEDDEQLEEEEDDEVTEDTADEEGEDEEEVEEARPARPAAKPAAAASNGSANGTADGGAKPAGVPVTAKVTVRATPRPASNADPRPKPINYELPPLSLLEDAPPIDRSEIARRCQEQAQVLAQTLTEFKLDVEVVGIEPGPVITVFELKLAPGIKVSQVASLSNDMARALKAPAVRVVAPLPGRNTVGIEVPNLDKEKVRIKEIMQVFGNKAEGMGIPIYLGKDASGAPLVSDLTRMPHALIAGTTGSGKSVCVSSIVLSILMTRSPEDVRMILIDPKVVELAMFKDIPHLMCPIVTDMAKAESILDWAAEKMDERYELLAEAGVKDIRSYNRLGIDGLKERMAIASDEEMARIPVKLPYIVIVIDELADMMMTSAKQVEFYLVRIAQKSRAVGIHLIVSTQRPQANVVTGLIKANLPTRISFRVSSRLDSRIVLDQNGGEVLMGQGDMLFLPPGSAKLVRGQGTFISDDELRAIVKHARSQGEPQYSPELVRIPSAGDGPEERDELFDQAVDILIETRRGSVSLLQRRLTIGYGRASRLIDQMAAAGIVGDYKGSQAREVLITREEWETMKAQRDSEEASEQGSLFTE
jgi:S-DNA-T family DNA segregation ATPase FtsK/SpoIIIE